MTASGQPAQAAPEPEVRVVAIVPLTGFYALYFATVGITLPFLPAYLKSLGLPESEVGLLLALGPLMAMVAPPFWGHLADRFGRLDRVLAVISLGALLGFAPILVAERFLPLALTLAAYGFFASSITSIVDSLALHRVAAHGGSYSRIRLFGSLGFVLSSTAFGFAVDKVDRRTVVAPLALMALYFLWSLTLRAKAAIVPDRHPLQGVRLLRDRDLALVLFASALHWVACAPFHGNFGIHVTWLGLSPWVIGVSAAIGVIAEMVVMYAYPHFAEKVAPRHLLFVAFFGSAVRWAGMAVVDSAAGLVALSVFHGLTFGAFYVAAVQYVGLRVPESMRATGQALMVSVTFGLGGLVGFAAAGTGYQFLGGHRLFLVAAVLELIPALMILMVKPARRPQPT